MNAMTLLVAIREARPIATLDSRLLLTVAHLELITATRGLLLGKEISKS